MVQSALLLTLLGLLLGLLPLWPQGSAVGVIGAALGVLPALSGLLLALASRNEALRSGLRLRRTTMTLGLSVAATLLCSVWMFALVVIWRTPRPPSPQRPGPAPQAATLPRLAQAPAPPTRTSDVSPARPFEYTDPT